MRKELEARTLSSKGLKSQLIARLTKSLKMEQEKEESEEQVKEVNCHFLDIKRGGLGSH